MLVRALAIASSLAVVDVAALGAERITGPSHVQLGDGISLIVKGNASVAVDRTGTGGVGKSKTISMRIFSGSVRFVRGAKDKKTYKINTPQGTIGLCRCSFDVTVRNGKTHILLPQKPHLEPAAS
jgi:hypothetical protein